MQWIADRFFSVDGAWIDASSGRSVRIRLLGPGDPGSPGANDEIGWSEQCATLATLRHPLLNALIDYGVGPKGCRFEAYERGDTVQAGPSSHDAERLLQHLALFLRACDLSLDSARAPFALRRVVEGPGDGSRPLGVRIQGRRALAAVEESLDGASPVGPCVVNVCGAIDAGLKTLRVLTARAARVRGFVPVSPGIVGLHPIVAAVLRERHVCILDDIDEHGRSAVNVSQLIGVLGASSARRHVIVRFQRDLPAASKGIALEPLGLRTMVGMVFAGADGGPDEQELFAAARTADGLPGVFVAHLRGGYRRGGLRAAMVHETAHLFGPEPLPAPHPPPVVGGRVLGAALRAPQRADALAQRGRHAFATRVLTRALRVLEGRDRPFEAAKCAIQLGWLALDRGTTAVARERFEQAYRLAGNTSLAVEASVGMGVVLTDEDRLIEAEAILRGAVAAAETIHDTWARVTAATALARCLLWQARFEEATAVAVAQRDTDGAKAQRARLLAVLARAQCRIGRVPTAVAAAREAQQIARAADPRLQACAELAVAETLDAAGDAEGARSAIVRASRMARTHHLPLVRVRALLLSARAGNSATSSRSIARLRQGHLPSLLARRIGPAASTFACRRVEPVAELEMLLDLSQRATDDAAAAAAICKVVAERLGAATVGIFGSDDRTLAVHGRGWPSMPLAARQAIGQGAALRPDGGREPQESAEPMRYGGEIIGALACRWTAGRDIDIEGAVVFLRAAALSAAPHVRAMLDRTVPQVSAVWGDLLGASPGAAELRDWVARAARAPFPVLIEGESGCGKELVARAVHRLSARRERRFCALNCAALTDDLIETELFGHTRGAFTGAASERSGLFEESDGGTLFLDEVGELSPRAQAKLLRVVQEGEVRRVGENFPRRVDVRVVAATNRKLEEEVAAGRFRADLRFRLDVVRIPVPPLRERTSDIPLLAAHFWQDASARVGSKATLSGEALAALSRYDWPGNVRELQNVIAWIAVHAPRRGRVGASALPRHVAQLVVTVPATFEAARQEFERRFVRAALAGANGQRGRAAAALGVSRQGLSKMIRRLGI